MTHRKASSAKAIWGNRKASFKITLRLFAAGICTAMLLASNATLAQVVFGGTVGLRHYCQITVTNSGTMTINGAGNQLSSLNGGGARGAAQIFTTNGSFWVSVDAPTSFQTMPTGGDTGVTFGTLYNMSGATSAVNVPGTTDTKAKKGTSTVEIDLTASRTDAFPTGNYQAVTILRCE